MKSYIFCLMLLLAIATNVLAQKNLSGIVRSKDDNKPIVGASVKIKGHHIGTTTDQKGHFTLVYTDQDFVSLIFSHVLYKSQELEVADLKEQIVVYLSPNAQELEEVGVFATGYNKIPKERATGSFELLSDKQLGQSLSGNILDRLEGATGSLAFDRRTAITKESADNNSSLRLRGLSTLMSDASPLVIVNNFPFEGDLRDINPNDIESIVFLKDAAASAIWGAKSGNGVIVIQLKEAKKNGVASIQASVTTRIGEKPDFMNTARFIASKDYMELEEKLFDENIYREANSVLLSPFVYLLYQKKKNIITDDDFQRRRSMLESTDIRKEASKYLYRQAVDKITSISVRGGSDIYSYLFSLGYDDSKSSLIGNNSNRLSMRMDNQFKLHPRLSAQITTDFLSRKEDNNAVSVFDQSGLVPANKSMIYPYASLVNDDGSGSDMAISYSPFYLADFEKNYKRNWYFNPINELKLRDNTSKNQSLRMVSQLKYVLDDALSISVNYSFNKSDDNNVNFYNRDSYYARNMINKFIQSDGQLIIPDGDIRHSNMENFVKHAGRIQGDFNKTLFQRLAVNGLIGTEISDYTATYDPLQILYDFDRDNYIGQNVFNYSNYYTIRPEGSLRIPNSGTQIFQLSDRFVSYYGLGSLTWDNRYLLSGSLRWDASNLFGVKTNQKGVPLWSIGGGWLIHQESFMQSLPFSELKLRATLGENGNINKNATSYPTAAFSVSGRTNLTEALLKTAGNPQLKWERVRSWNIGLDWSLNRHKVGGSMDVFKKNAYDLIGYKVADPTTGINPILTGVKQMINYGTFQNTGVDIRMFVKNIKVAGISVFMDLTASKNWNKVLDYDVSTLSIYDYFQYIVPAAADKSRDVIYAFPWHGLDPATGQPLVSDGTNLTTTYGTNVTGFDPKNLLEVGNSFPLWNGTLRNEFSYKDLSLSFLFTWKGAYQFRRSSINYQELIESWNMHTDYYYRWQQSGDEKITNVPAVSTVIDRNRDGYYTNSTILMEDADHIRLQNLQLLYKLPLLSQKMHVEVLTVVENLGVIWAKNKRGIDPEYHMSYYNPPKQFTIGLRAKF